ncbi:ketoacyl-synt-domain-containing protein [Hymenopellis radicata]|nr:ketoacyl-synt-domain-containing protein [Hymenopellis radicata]
MASSDILVFNGQGAADSKLSQMRAVVLQSTSVPAVSVLLTACHEAFRAEMSTLPASESGVDLTDFPTKESLLAVNENRYTYNAIMSGSTLFLVSSHGIVKWVDSHVVGVIGFSSGILPAVVAATSNSLPSFLHHAVEAYKLALWIGFRAHRYREEIMRHSFVERAAPWSLVFLGTDKTALENAIMTFTTGNDTMALYITAVIDSTIITVSGRPDVLASFAQRFKGTVRETTLETLYHSGVHLHGARQAVLDDTRRRSIQFPTLESIHLPIRSSFSGQVINASSSDGQSLLELVVDMILVQPVNWDSVADALTTSSLPSSVRVLNFGPGIELTKLLVKELMTAVTMVDLSVVNSVKPPTQEPIAIVGMAVNMPGSPNVAKLWEVLEQGISTISEIPESRFKISDYREGNRQMKAHTGNFINNADELDNKFFKISPREAKSMDPQQRVLLHTAYEALEDAGYVPNATESFNPDTFGCFIGVATNDYVQNLRNNIDVYYSTGTLKAFLSGRLSYAMQFGGPSIVIDTACSSSVVTVYQGARALMNGDCNAALVGGINVITSPDMFLGLDRGHFLSPTGQCKSFDESADGYSRSEGCGLFVLKRLSDALAEQDHIWGVIRAVDVNQNGLATSITHPHVPTQVDLFRAVLEHAGIPPRAELDSIRRVFLAGGEKRDLHVTSIKANIGHLEAASGAAGLAKLLLMLRHRMIPRCISLRKLNSNIRPGDGLVIDQVATTWEPSRAGQTRMALLNNFGAAGSNGAILVEEHVPNTPELANICHVLGISAKTEEALDRLKERYIEWMQSSACTESWSDIAYTATARRQLYPWRTAISAAKKEEAVTKLKTSKLVDTSALQANPKVVFVFSGQGSQYLGMGQALYYTSLLFHSIVDQCHTFLISAGFVGVLGIISPDGVDSSLSETDEFEAYQAAIFVLEYALARLWMSWGLKPSAVVGHSLGEYAALVVADVLSLEGALLIVANRVRIMVTKCTTKSTGMIAVNLSSSSIASHIASFEDLSVACFNSPTDCVVSGPLISLSKFKQYLDVNNVGKNIMLSVPFGYHSSAMHPVVADLTHVANLVAIRSPTIPIVSNVLGETVRPGDTSVFHTAYFSQHCLQPVQFQRGIESLLRSEKVDVWLEIGPHTPCLPMLRSILQDKSSLLLSSLKKQQDPWMTLTNSLALMYQSNVAVNWRGTYTHIPSVLCIPLPSYPFSAAKFWVPFTEDSHVTQVEKVCLVLSDYAMLNEWIQKPTAANGFTSILETPMSRLQDRIKGHRVAQLPLCPASVYLEQVFAGIATTWAPPKDQYAPLRDITFVSPLVYDETVARVIITTLTLNNDMGTFIISSRVDGAPDAFFRSLPVINRNACSITERVSRHETISTRTIYQHLFQRVVDYSKEYHTVQNMTIDVSHMECVARVRIPLDETKDKHVVHPVFLDTLLHVSGFLANLHGEGKDVFICSEVGSVKVLPDLVDVNRDYTVYCSNILELDGGVISGDAWALLQDGPSSRLVAFMKGMRFRRVRLDSFSKMLARSAGQLALVPRPPPLVPQRSGVNKTTSQPIHVVERGVLDIIAETCGTDAASFTLDTDLEKLGVDSLMSIEIFASLKAVFPAELNPNVLSECRTAGDIVREVMAAGNCTPSASLVSGVSTPGTLVEEREPVEEDGRIQSIKRILANMLDISVSDIQDHMDFAQLGLDSLSSLEALYAIREELGLDLPPDFFLNYSSVNTVTEYLRSTQAPLLKASPDFLAHLKLDAFPYPVQAASSASNNLPLFVFHDGSGLINYYSRLSTLNRAVWGIYNPHFLTSEPWDGVHEMAGAYAGVISEIAKGPVLLGGWSFGGVVAYETALQLVKFGINVKGVLLIDAPNPENHVPLSVDLIAAATGEIKSEVGRLVKTQFRMNSAMLKDYDPYTTGGRCPPLAYLRSTDPFNPPGVNDIPLWLSDRSERRTGWEGIAGCEVRVVDIPGNHFQAFHPCNISDMSSKIMESCLASFEFNVDLEDCVP